MIELIFGLIVVGVLLYIVSLIPMDGTIKKIIYALVILAIVFYIVNWFGYLPESWHHLRR